MPAFDYAVIRVVPRVERGEFVNAGLVLCCPRLEVLMARVVPVADRVRGLDAKAPVDAIERHLEAWVGTAHGEPGAGSVARMPLRERFHWLVHPKSAMLQVGEVHSGICTDATASFERIWRGLFG